MIPKTSLIAIRPAVETDLNFIYDSWLKGLRYGNDLFELIEAAVYFENYRKVIQALLSRSDVRVACLKEDPDVIIGYSVSQGDRVHWVQVKESWRKMGIARDLIPSHIKTYSHVTKAAHEIFKTHPGYIFNPFLR